MYVLVLFLSSSFYILVISSIRKIHLSFHNYYNKKGKFLLLLNYTYLFKYDVRIRIFHFSFISNIFRIHSLKYSSIPGRSQRNEEEISFEKRIEWGRECLYYCIINIPEVFVFIIINNNNLMQWQCCLS